MGLSSAGTAALAYSHVGPFLATNISNAPAAIQVFSNSVRKPWPAPEANLRKPSEEYKKAAKLLYENYILRYFMNPRSIAIDYKRFVVSSDLKDMGFETDLRHLPRSSKFKYMNFCNIWLDYSKQEDMVQVGRVDYLVILKLKCYLMFHRSQNVLSYGKRAKLPKTEFPKPSIVKQHTL